MIRVGVVLGEPTPYRAPQLDRVSRLPDLDVTVVYCARTVQRRSPTTELDHRAVFLDGPSLPLTRLLHHDYPVTPAIRRVLDRERFDCLVIGGWSLYGTQAAILWARRHGVPYLLISENHLREPRPGWITALRRLVLPRLLRPAAGHLVTGTLAREHALAFGARPGTVEIFPNTIDVEAFAADVDALRPRRAELRRAFGLPDDAVVVLYVGRLIPMKAPRALVEAVGRAGPPVHLLVVGDGPERPALEGAPQAVFTGTLDRARLAEAYAAADALALLSWRETWGVVVNEAMAAGLPLVLSDRVGAAADLLEPGGNGELVPPGNADAAAAALSRLAADPDLRRRYGARSRELVRPWGYEPGVEAFARAVRGAVSAGPSRPRTSRDAGP